MVSPANGAGGQRALRGYAIDRFSMCSSQYFIILIRQDRTRMPGTGKIRVHAPGVV